MNRVVALLATALLLAGLAGCGGSGAEPGAPKGATVVLDFTPNAVHTGIYAGQAEGFYKDAGIDLHVQGPGESTAAPQLPGAARTARRAEAARAGPPPVRDPRHHRPRHRRRERARTHRPDADRAA